MKKLAVCSLGLGVGAVAFIQLPVLASHSILDAAASFSTRQTANIQTLNEQTVNSSTVGNQTISTMSHPMLRQSQRLAVALATRSLRQGDRGQDVRLLQRYLIQNGLYAGFADGVYGSETANAVITYQRIRDLPATGVADEETLLDMEFDFLPETSTPIRVTSVPTNAVPSLFAGNLVPGNTGSDVIALQRRLNDVGIAVSVDGNYGPQTEQAVRIYQRVQGLSVTGDANTETLKTIGFEIPDYPYVAAVIADESQLAEVQFYFSEAFIDRNRQGEFINIGSFAERSPAEARVDAAAGRGFTTRVLYR